MHILSGAGHWVFEKGIGITKLKDGGHVAGEGWCKWGLGDVGEGEKGGGLRGWGLNENAPR